MDFEAHTRIEIPYTINTKVNFWNHMVFMDLTPYSLVGGYRYTMSKLKDHKLSNLCRENLRVLTHSCYNKDLTSYEHHCFVLSCDASRGGVMVPFDIHKRHHEDRGLA